MRQGTTQLTARNAKRGLLVSMVFALGGCGADSASRDAELAAPPSQKQPVIEEPDLYRLEGDYLYVQNPHTGLNIIDVQNPASPRLVGRAAVTGGAGAEMYLQKKDHAIILLKAATPACQPTQKLDPKGWQFGTELVLVDTSDKTSPKIKGRFCIPGQLTASRSVDEIVYLVTSPLDQMTRGTRALSIDVSDPHAARLVQELELHGGSREILVTANAIFVAGLVMDTQADTMVHYIAIGSAGKMQPSGMIEVPGVPQGRFHMSFAGDQFRIVTYDVKRAASRLSIIDISDPMRLELMGELENIGAGERLYATRFDGDRAYVVTYRETDPLWIISLEDPTAPYILGELHVPGWSDFIFPRGNKLVTVGRGDRGAHLGLSLFDVSDPTAPRSLHQIQLGDPSATSTANVDHRAVTILEMPNGKPLIVVPHTVAYWAESCSVKDVLQLIELEDNRLQVRGSVSQKGTIQRSFPVGSQLYSVSDHEVTALDVSNLDQPRVSSTVTVGNAGSAAVDQSYCDTYWRDGFYGHDDCYFLFCSVSADGSIPRPPLGLLTLGLTWLLLRRRAPGGRAR